MWDPGAYETSTDEIGVGPHLFKITRIASIDRLYDDLIARGPGHEDVVDERIPYWADLWPAAIGLSEYLVAHRERVRGRSVLEIGCGLGLAGLTAARLGGRVTMTDYVEEALTLARLNAERNGETGITFAKLDWRIPDPEQAADIVLASDVAYERRAFDVLPRAFKTLVRPGGSVLASDPGREYAGPFFESLRQEGFSVDSVEVPVKYRGIETRVRVYELGVQSL